MKLIRKLNAVLYTYRFPFVLLMVLTYVTNCIRLSIYNLSLELNIYFIFFYSILGFIVSLPFLLLFSFIPYRKYIFNAFSILNILSAVVIIFIGINFPDTPLNEVIHLTGEVDIYTSIEYVFISLFSIHGLYTIGIVLFSIILSFCISYSCKFLKKQGYILFLLVILYSVLYQSFSSDKPYKLHKLLNSSIPVLQIVDSYWIVSQVSVDNDKYIFEMSQKHIPVLRSVGKHPDIIVILGESATRSRMQVYDYSISTTPFLTSVKPVLWQTNSVYPNTADNLKVLFSSLTKDDDLNSWKEKHQLFRVFKNTLYKTYWISNQMPTGFFGSTEFIVSHFADYKWFAKHNQYDEVILPEFEKMWKEDYNPKLVVLHLMGSHLWFSNRYPSSFNKFTSKDEITTDYHKNKTRAEYDNSLLYTDYIIQNVFEKIKDDNAIIVYLSDHGTTIYGKYDTVGTSFKDDPDMKTIPFLFIATDKYKENNPVYYNALKQQMYSTSDHLYDLILYLAGYRIYNPEYPEIKFPNKH